MRFLKQFLRTYFIFLGAMALAFCVLNRCGILIIPEYFEAGAIANLPVILASTLLFRTGMSLREMWFKRVIVMFVAYISYLAIYLYHVLYGPRLEFMTFEPKRGIGLYPIVSLIAIFVFSCAAYTIADLIEKRTMKRINEKLAENE